MFISKNVHREDTKMFNMLDFNKKVYYLLDMLSISLRVCVSIQQKREYITRIPYASAIGSLMYFMLCRINDITHAVSVTSRYKSNPSEEHGKTIKNILTYRRRTKDLILTYGEGVLKIDGYTDSNF